MSSKPPILYQPNELQSFIKSENAFVNIGENCFLPQVSHPLVTLIPLSVSDTFVKLTWNGSVRLTDDLAPKPTISSRRHHHHIETRYRLSRHLFLKYRHYRETPTSPTAPAVVVKLGALSKHHTVSSLNPNTVYEFCIEFQPHDRPETLLDCLILRTLAEVSPYAKSSYGKGYHEGRTIMFVLLVAIVASVSCMCFGCYAVAVGRKLWKYKSKKGFSSLGYTDEMVYDEINPEYHGDLYRTQEDNPKKPLIARI